MYIRGMDYSSVPAYVTEAICELDKQIIAHERILLELRTARQIWVTHNPQPIQVIYRNPDKLTRALIVKVLKSCNNPVQTVQIIDLLFSELSANDRREKVQHLSVIFNQMKKDLEIIKKAGVKGNFYRLKT